MRIIVLLWMPLYESVDNFYSIGKWVNLECLYLIFVWAFLNPFMNFLEIRTFLDVLDFTFVINEISGKTMDVQSLFFCFSCSSQIVNEFASDVFLWDVESKSLSLIVLETGRRSFCPTIFRIIFANHWVLQDG